MKCILGALLLCATLSAQRISTAAGNTSWGSPVDAAVDTAGNIYVTDQSKTLVYRVNQLGETSIIAGTGGRGFGPEGVPATEATFGDLTGITVAPDGTIYVADTTLNRIRRIAPNGIITTIAGTGQGGFSGDGGPATAARLWGPRDLALDAAGNLYVTDISNRRIRRITPAGIINTVAGTGQGAFSGDGGPPLLADCRPGWLAIAPDGTIFFTDDGDDRSFGNKRVRRIRNNVISTIAGPGPSFWSGDGGPASAAGFTSANGIAVDPAGNVYVSEWWGARVRRITPEGIISTYAGTGVVGLSGDGGPANRAQLSDPFGLAIDQNGNLLIADVLNQRIRRVTPDPDPVLNSFATVPSGLSVTVAGAAYTTPASVPLVPGAVVTLTALPQQVTANSRLAFASWSNGGAATHSITVGNTPTTYTATFVAQNRLSLSANPLIGGTVTVSPSSPDGFYGLGTAVQVTAVASPTFAVEPKTRS